MSFVSFQFQQQQQERIELKYTLMFIIVFFMLTDVDSSKLDLSKELANDFSNAFDVLIDGNDSPLNTDDFVRQRYFLLNLQVNEIMIYFSCSMELIYRLIHICVMKHFAWKIKFEQIICSNHKAKSVKAIKFN